MSDITETLVNAEGVAKSIMSDLRLNEPFERKPDGDGEGWFSFIFRNDGKMVEVEIQGTEYPRLYIEGGIRGYGFALGLISVVLELKE